MSNRVDVAQSHKTHGVKGEQIGKGATYVQPGKGTRSLWVLGELLTYKVPSQRTGGAYSLFEVQTPPGSGPPPHVQHREDECFYVLEGEFEFSNGEETLRVGAGCLIYVPKGTLHAHKNVGEGAGRMLVSQTPGGLYERFFQEVGKPVDGDDGEPFLFEEQSEARRIVEVAAEHGIEIPPRIAR